MQPQRSLSAAERLPGSRLARALHASGGRTPLWRAVELQCSREMRNVARDGSVLQCASGRQVKKGEQIPEGPKNGGSVDCRGDSRLCSSSVIGGGSGVGWGWRQWAVGHASAEGAGWSQSSPSVGVGGGDAPHLSPPQAFSGRRLHTGLLAGAAAAAWYPNTDANSGPSSRACSGEEMGGADSAKMLECCRLRGHSRRPARTAQPVLRPAPLVHHPPPRSNLLQAVGALGHRHKLSAVYQLRTKQADRGMRAVPTCAAARVPSRHLTHAQGGSDVLSQHPSRPPSHASACPGPHLEAGRRVHAKHAGAVEQEAHRPQADAGARGVQLKQAAQGAGGRQVEPLLRQEQDGRVGRSVSWAALCREQGQEACSTSGRCAATGCPPAQPAHPHPPTQPHLQPREGPHADRQAGRGVGRQAAVHHNAGAPAPHIQRSGARGACLCQAGAPAGAVAARGAARHGRAAAAAAAAAQAGSGVVLGGRSQIDVPCLAAAAAAAGAPPPLLLRLLVHGRRLPPPRQAAAGAPGEHALSAAQGHRAGKVDGGTSGRSAAALAAPSEGQGGAAT